MNFFARFSQMTEHEPEMSIYLSVENAWEDLYVQSPNRARLEGCLLTTILLVVCCIVALLVYVFVHLQPQGKHVIDLPFQEFICALHAGKFTLTETNFLFKS
ncbi:hypothetical protein HPB50_026052 [Hyalomma asiaticum]|uniref:Uncharacterized protein n=1 Tax=Hyalomma asiaticum TaxID=266040 RepID=A0ACB7SPM5_HYAAI|nr:hypothetical protein HPB50_026052 [Hyalomma asiaticum]